MLSLLNLGSQRRGVPGSPFPGRHPDSASLSKWRGRIPLPGYCAGYLVINTHSSKGPSITKSQIWRVAQTLSIELAYLTSTLEEARDAATETFILPGSRKDFPGVPSGLCAIGALMSSSHCSLRSHHLLCSCYYLSLHRCQ